MADITYFWRGSFTNDEVNELHAGAFKHRVFDDDWIALTNRHSLGWVVARSDDALVGFANVLWDGLVHAWIQDVMVFSDYGRRGVGTGLVAVAKDEAKAAGCEWMHVDFDDELQPFYLGTAGFTPTNGGLINLTETK